ncbi:MAG: polymerase sigma-70 factor, subfamily [Tenuifilum sp.]|jgi:RNA polymerase sigma-70 factor (ECF subfamily)|uniref:RNA polymerase sigma-70 factor n=1 Tax=Tenuifilum sp. TaxID=2760880 RepID=UPI0024AA68CB|nr:RNA polymerase sigma-70 factor [Tenuifilum sp.]MDI3526021.1 polymerase sigma-70 factor, subfamily [Tenuifilum sp.]
MLSAKKENELREFEEIFKSYYEPLCRYAYSFVLDADEAEEIVQEFFYQFWLKRKKISIKFSMKSYMYRSIRNRCIRFLQHKKLEDMYSSQNVLSLSADTPQDELDRNQLNEVVQETLKSLPSRIRRTFLLSRVNGLKYKEIAKLLSVSIKTVEADMGKALLELRTQLVRRGFINK